MIIIQGDTQLEIGKNYIIDVVSPENEWQTVGFLVIREATLEELQNCIREHNAKDSGIYGKYFYEVLMD